ncbi:hypothetical protein [Thermosipho melanesiensis]|uniref:Uncharacterized protein n=2 Tax=Thermosipho melanesiensis TaxID=46541 RepID=A6LLA8_THEM4|nr:hypothetical protein [Thermosipho melanesiensis]ABR30709.1 hypothetical protein Tmel_0848 [Thermosipho melanesiensis BI429]APT73839.1 hypothetical protein BW47_04560 [Thermosipho melanesiensis]
MLNATVEWYIFLKKDYQKTLDLFYVVNYIRHDYYNRGISPIKLKNSKNISFVERLKSGEEKKVTYKIIDTKEGMFLKREVNGRGNYLGPFKTSIKFEDAVDVVYIVTEKGKFIIPKAPVKYKILKILVSF